jgi:eukaryotic-like serine/threonine-protein kinase
MATCPTCRTHYADDVKSCSTDGEPLLPDEVVAALDPDLQIGQTVGEYRVESKIGEGGFGAVYRAVHPLIGKTVAIKVLHRQYSSNPQMVSRFVAEARAVNQIKNRNIIDIFSFGALEDGRQYYVMELLDGMTLDAYVKRKGRVAPDEALPIFRGIARALDAAHATGIAHRDLKPENVFLLFDDDGTIFPKLLDFGIAKLLGDSGMSAHKTRTGTPLGTPYYMSPEQCRGRNVDHRTDIYSFGVLVFETLTGRLLFEGEDLMEILMQHTSSPPRRPSVVRPELPPGLDAPVLAFLEKDPALRPPSVSAGVDALAIAARDAGFDVKVSARTSPGPGAGAAASGPVRVGGGVTPVEAEARTMIPVDASKTVPAAEAAAKPAGGRRLVTALVAATAVMGIAAAATLRGGGPPAAPATPAAPVVVPIPASAPPVPAAPVPVVKPAEAPSSAAAAPAEVELTIDATPKGVDVYQGAAKIGSSAAPVRIKRGDEKVKLTFKAPGYAPKDVEVPASANATISVSLVKAGGGGKKPEVEF